MNDRTLRIAAMLIALAGIGVAGYLTWAHFADETVICVRGGGCETVQQSSYSEIAGIPVAVLGLLSYLTVLGLLVWDAPVARLSTAMIALVGVFFGAYLAIVQLFVIDAVCVWCMANDLVIGPALALVTLLRLRS